MFDIKVAYVYALTRVPRPSGKPEGRGVRVKAYTYANIKDIMKEHNLSNICLAHLVRVF